MRGVYKLEDSGLPRYEVMKPGLLVNPHQQESVAQNSVYIRAVDKWVLGYAETLPNFWHSYVKDRTCSTKHTTAYDVK